MHRIERTKFLEALLRVQPGLSARDFVEQSSCFAFSEGWVATFNDEICCRTRTGLPPELTGAVHASSLIRVIENMSDEYVDVDATGREFAVRGARKKAGVRMEAEIVLPVESVEAPAGGWTPLPEDFGDALKTVAACAGTNDEEFLTVCVHIAPGFMEACDRRQASRYELDTGVTRPFLVRAKSIVHAADRGMTKIGESDNWVHLRNKDLVFSCRRHLEEFPDISKMLAFRGAKAVLPRGAEEAAKLGAVFADDKENDRVTVTLTPGHMVIRGEGTHGWASADLEMAYRGEPVVFRIAPGLLTEIVRRHTECEIGPGKLFVAGERWRYLTVLGKVEDAAAKPAKGRAAVADAEPEPVAAGADADDTE